MNLKDRKYDSELLFLFASLFVAMLLKYLLYGFNYFPLLDDYIQYGGYPRYNDASYVLFDIGTIKTRPFASVLDVCFWGKLWSFPSLYLLLPTLLYFLSGFFFYKTLKEAHLSVSPLFLIVYLLCPVSFEATYWLSASSRIIVGMFCASICFYSLVLFFKNDKGYLFALHIGFFLLACGFYEAVGVFAFAGVFFLSFLAKDKKTQFFSVCISALILISMFVYYILAKDIGRMGTRAEGGFDIVKAFSMVPDLLSQFFEALFGSLASIFSGGFISGLSFLFSKGIVGIIYLAVIFIVSIIIGRNSLFNFEKSNTNRKNIIFLTASVLLMFVPLAPSLMSEPVWITLRTVFTSFFAIAILFDRIIALFKSRAILFVVSSALCFIFLVSGINEYDTARRVNQLDNTLLKTVILSLPDEVLRGEKDAVVLLDEEPAVKQAFYYKDHIKSVFCADWSLTGAVRSSTGNMKIKKIVPVFTGDNFDCSNYFVVDLRTQ